MKIQIPIQKIQAIKCTGSQTCWKDAARAMWHVDQCYTSGDLTTHPPFQSSLEFKLSMCCAFSITIESISTWINHLSCFFMCFFNATTTTLTPTLFKMFLPKNTITLLHSLDYIMWIDACGSSKFSGVVKPNLGNFMQSHLPSFARFLSLEIIQFFKHLNYCCIQDFMEQGSCRK